MEGPSAVTQAYPPHWTIRTGRLLLAPMAPEHLPDLVRLKGDEAAFGIMLHGTRTPARTAEELADDISFWKVRGYGTWVVIEQGTGDFLGIVGLMERPDGRGVALRFALWPHCRGKGYAREAARAALAFGHEAGLDRIIAVARDTNHASRAVLGDIGMKDADTFMHNGNLMRLLESVKG